MKQGCRHRLLIHSEEGMVSIFAAIFLGLFGLGFIALTVDTGILYLRHSQMVTAADAGALAAAVTLRDAAAGGNEADSDEAIAEALLTARNYARANGADTGMLQVSIGHETVTLPDGTTDVRQVVEVEAAIDEPPMFARVWGRESTAVGATALGTWGLNASVPGDRDPLPPVVSAGDQRDIDSGTSSDRFYAALIR